MHLKTAVRDWVLTLLLWSMSAPADIETALRAALKKSPHRDQLVELYRAEGHRLLWSEGGVATQQTTALIQYLSTATTLGLQPQDYDAVSLAAVPPVLSAKAEIPWEAWALFDVRLSAALLSYVNDVH